MTPRTWAAWSAAGLVVVLTSTNPAYRALVVLVALNVLLTWRRRDAPLRGLLLMVAVAAGLSTLVDGLLSHSGAHVLVRLPDGIPAVGGTVTLEGFLYGADIGLGIAAAVLVVAPLSRVLHAHDLLDAVPAPLQRTAAVTGSAVNLVPALGRTAVAVSESQRLRGGHGSRMRDWYGIAAPTLLSALDDSLVHAEAMEARVFGAGPRTRYVTARVRPGGVAVLLAATAAAACAIAARASGALPDWYPFPAASFPVTTAAGLVACALLATPLVTWTRS